MSLQWINKELLLIVSWSRLLTVTICSAFDRMLTLLLVATFDWLHQNKVSIPLGFCFLNQKMNSVIHV